MHSLSKLPKVDSVVGAPELTTLRSALGQSALTAIVREVIAAARREALGGSEPPELPDIVARVQQSAERRLRSGLRPVVNATGVLLHTNLGRAPLPAAALENVLRVCAGNSSVELDVESGERCRRGAHAEALLAELVGAEAALVVNNNAAAVLLGLTALATGRDVIVSRGELVEESAEVSASRTSFHVPGRPSSRSERRTAPASRTTSAPRLQRPLCGSGYTRATSR